MMAKSGKEPPSRYGMDRSIYKNLEPGSSDGIRMRFVNLDGAPLDPTQHSPLMKALAGESTPTAADQPPASEAPEPAAGSSPKLRPAAGDRPPIAPVATRADGLPEDCPVRPLGENGRDCYYLDDGNHYWELSAKDHNRLNIMRMFGKRTDFLYRQWARTKLDKNGEEVVTGWRPELAAEELSAACSRLGDWDAAKRVRGVGAHRAANGGLILHCGDVIVSDGETQRPGLIGAHVYPAASALPQPATFPVKAMGDDIAWLHCIVKRWNWLDGDLAAYLCFCSIPAAFVGGALPWRAHPWFTGGTGTGKSTLKTALLESVFGPWLVGCEDPSPAGIWQRLGHATLPIAIDEHEPDELDQGRRPQAVVKLARMAASGALLLRGGSDHHGKEFLVRSMFFFFSILVPPLVPQDRNRLCILRLGPLPDSGKPDLDPRRLASAGRQILRRLVDHWPRFEVVNGALRNALLAERLNARAADVYAALLACGELVVRDAGTFTPAYVKGLALAVARMCSDDIEGDQPDEQRCLTHLLTTLLPLDSSATKRAVAEWIRRAALGMNRVVKSKEDAEIVADAKHAAHVLRCYGMRVYDWPETVNGASAARAGERGLAVSYSHRELARLFDGSRWHARSGTNGVWRQALGRLPGAEACPVAFRFAGPFQRATFVPFTVIFGPKYDLAKLGDDFDDVANQ